jgi:hypothetical protein
MADNKVIGKTMFYIIVAVLAVALIWVYSIANTANKMATENADAVRVPEYKVYHVAGGPGRFASEFEGASEGVENVNQGDYLWSSIIVQNVGEEDDEDIEINITAAIPIEKVYFATTDRFVGEVVSQEENANEVTINMDGFDINENIMVFIPMLPTGYEKPFDKLDNEVWGKEYQSYLEKVTIESDMTEVTIYAPGYAALYE